MRRIDTRHIRFGLLLIGPLVLFGRMLFLGEVLYWGTPMLQFVPWHRYALEVLKLGHIPLWNPLLGMGAPLLANLQSALFYPPNVLLWIVSPEHGHGYLVVLHLIIAGLGMQRLAKRLGVGAFGQLVSGLAFSLSGYMVARAWFISINHAAAWLPWILLAAEALLDGLAERKRFQASLPALLALTAALALQWLAGHAQTAWYTLLLLMVWVIWRMRKQMNKETLLWMGTRFLAAGILAFAIAAVQLIPALEYLSLSQRAAALDREFALTYSFWPWRILGLLAPGLFGNPANGDYWGYGNYWEDAIYIGILPFLFGIGSVWYAFRRWKEEGSLERFLFFVVLIAFLFALGKNTPLYSFLFDHIPTFDLFQAPARWNIILVFCLALLAGLGAERWKTPKARGLYWTRLLTAGAGIIAIASYLGMRVIPELEPSFFRSFVQTGLILTLAGLFTLFLPKDRRKLKIGLAGGFILFDLVLAGWGLNPSISPEVFEGNVLGSKGIDPGQRVYMPSDLENQLKYEQTHRFDTFDPGVSWRTIREIALPNTSMLDGVASINNFDPLVTGRYLDFFSALEQMEPVDRDELLAWMGVSYRITPDPDDGGSVIFESLNEGGRVHFASDTVIATSREQALSLLTSGEIDLHNQVILEQVPVEGKGANGAGELLEMSEAEPNSLSIRVRMHGAGWLVLADTWYPGWKAYIDGSAVDLHQANYLFRGVRVPDGTHSIEFKYQPGSFLIGGIMSLTGLLVTIYLGFRCIRRD